jgi:hypothetical protein
MEVVVSSLACYLLSGAVAAAQEVAVEVEPVEVAVASLRVSCREGLDR